MKIIVSTQKTQNIRITEKRQPKYIAFLKTLSWKSSQSFSSKWYKEFLWLHYNQDKDAAYCCTCMSAEIKRLKTVYHNKDKDEEYITHGYRTWRHATENVRVQE